MKPSKMMKIIHICVIYLNIICMSKLSAVIKNYCRKLIFFISFNGQYFMILSFYIIRSQWLILYKVCYIIEFFAHQGFSLALSHKKKFPATGPHKLYFFTNFLVLKHDRPLLVSLSILVSSKFN